MKLVASGRIQESPPPLSVPNLHTQNEKVPFIGAVIFAKIWDKKAKQNTKKTFYEIKKI